MFHAFRLRAQCRLAPIGLFAPPRHRLPGRIASRVLLLFCGSRVDYLELFQPGGAGRAGGRSLRRGNESQMELLLGLGFKARVFHHESINELINVCVCLLPFDSQMPPSDSLATPDFSVLAWAKIEAVSGGQVVLSDQPVVSHFSISSLSFLFAPRGFFIRCRADTGEGKQGGPS